MKEVYFTLDTIDHKAGDFFREVREFRRGRPLVIQHKRVALLVLDMQRYFFSPDSHAFIPSAPAIVPGVNKLIQAVRVTGGPVIFTQHLNTQENSGSMARWWQDLIKPENPLAELIPEIETKGDRVMTKSQYDAFLGTNLEEILKGNRVCMENKSRNGRKSEAAPITQLIVCGVMTHLCLETTARSAFMRGFEVLFPVDTAATYNEKFHRASILNLSHGFALPVLKEEITSLLLGQ